MVRACQVAIPTRRLKCVVTRICTTLSMTVVSLPVQPPSDLLVDVVRGE
jgi:hypothetical protein